MKNKFEVALDRIKKSVCPRDNWTQEDIEHYKAIVEALEIASLQNWIPVTERLPEEHDSIFANLCGTDGWMSSMFRKVSNDVLACIKYEDGSRKVTMIRTRDGKWAQTTVFLGTVTHWMPLPEPPKEDA